MSFMVGRISLLFLIGIFSSWVAKAQLKLIPVQPILGSNNSSEAARQMEADTIPLPFWDDFSTYTGSPDTRLWLDGGGVYVNRTLALNPPTLGVATFDGATSTGGVYNADPNEFGLADTLVTKPINLGQLTSVEANSMYLSFYWQFFGISEVPDEEDSLRLLFRNQQNEWEVIDVFDRDRVLSNDTFTQVIYKIEPRFLHAAFQIKFEGYARLSGPYDAWHIDYVFLDKNRTLTDKTYFDRAITSVPDYIFDGYSAIPIRQFFANPQKFLRASYIDIYNLDALLQPIEYSAIITNLFDSTEVIDILNFNTVVNPILQGLERRRLFSENLDYTQLDPDADSIYMKLNYFISSGDTIQANGLNYRVNDSVDVTFTLHDFFATDDGTAEFGLGLEQYGGKLAYMVVMEENDVLNGIEIHFPNITRNQQGTPFNLYIWKRLSESREDIIYRRENQTIEGSTYFNEFQYIRLPEIAVSDTFYIGYEQLSPEFMVVGYDKQHDFGDRIFYNVDAEWVQNDEFHGALMIRPHFGNTDTTTGLLDEFVDEITIYPNPSTGTFYIKGVYDQLTVYDLLGNRLFSKSYSQDNMFNLNDQKEGMYIVHLVRNGRIKAYKLLLTK